MLFLFLAASSSVFGGLGLQVLAGVVIAALVAVFTSYIARRRTKRADKKQEELSANEKLDAVIALTEKMHIAMVGEPPSPLNPSPPPGIVGRLEAIDERTTKVEHTLFSNGGRKNTILDRLGRIEERVVTGSDPAREVLAKQADQEMARKERDHEN